VKAAVGLTLLLLAPILLVLTPLGGRLEQACTPSSTTTDVRNTSHAAGALGPAQLNNAAVIVDSALHRDLGRRGAVIGVMTALTESSLRNLGHGDLAGPDSRGLFQQRTTWGPLAVRMDVVGSTRLFFDALEAVPAWQQMAPWAAAQAVQRSAFTHGANYRGNYPQATRVVDRMLPTTRRADTSDEPVAITTVSVSSPACAGSSAMTSSQVHLPATPGPYRGSETGCTLSDPTGTGGCVTGATAHALAETNAAFGHRWPWGVSCWDEHAWNPTSDHPLGRACDFTVGRLGSFPNEEHQRVGWALAEWFRVYADRLHVDYVIWDGRIWSVARAGEGWRRYDGGGIYDVSTSPTASHRDHLHLSLRM
jgi:hypothetical protein